MTIKTKFDIGQTVVTLIDDSARTLKIASVYIGSDETVHYGLIVGEDSRQTEFKPEHKVFESKQDLIDKLLKDE